MSLNIRSYQKELLNLKIDDSLNRKLIQNENKLLSLFVVPEKNKEFHSIDQKAINGRHIIIKRKASNKNKNINIKKKHLTKAYSTYTEDNDSLPQFSPRSNLSSYYDYDKSPRSPKSPRGIIKVNQNHAKIKKKSNKSVFSSTPKYNQKLNINKKRNKYKNKQKTAVINNKKHYDNNLNSSSTYLNNDTMDWGTKSERYFSPSPKSVNIEEMMIRFKIDEEKKKEWIENQRKKKEEEERRICSYAPKINKKSKKINLKFKDDFFGRQKLKDEQKKKKEEKLIAFLNKKKEDEINKSKMLPKKRNINRVKSVEKDKKSKITKTIDKLYEWDVKRKEKINEQRKKDNEKIAKNTHIPKINKRSSSMANLKNQKYSNITIFDRLAKVDPETAQKKKLLVELYTPTFRPNISVQRVHHEENKDIQIKKDNNESDIKPMETKGIISLSNQYLNDDDIQELYRNAVFQNRKKLFK